MSADFSPGPVVTDRVSTADVDEKRRLEYWQFVCSELIGSFELTDCQAENFEASIDLTRVGELKFGHFTGVSQTLHRKESMMRSSDTDDYVLLLESDNRFVLDHCGRQRSGRNGMVFIDITRPYYSHHPDKLDVIDVFIPRKALDRALGAARHAAGLSIDPTQASFPVISSFLRSLSDHGGKLDAASAERMASIAVDLIAAGLAEKIEAAPPHTMSGAAILCRAQAYIADRIGIAGLGIQEVAAALNISARRLHQIAADEGISLVDWMWERRLQRARTMLSELANHAIPIGGIAFQCGFSDAAHFSRRFKDHFGLAPTDYRAAHMRARTDAKPGAR